MQRDELNVRSQKQLFRSEPQYDPRTTTYSGDLVEKNVIVSEHNFSGQNKPRKDARNLLQQKRDQQKQEKLDIESSNTYDSNFNVRQANKNLFPNQRTQANIELLDHHVRVNQARKANSIFNSIPQNQLSIQSSNELHEHPYLYQYSGHLIQENPHQNSNYYTQN